MLLCVHASDTAGFQRNMSQLKAYYSSPELAARSEKRQMILGLHLLFLIVENRLAEFHSELELMAPADRTSREVAFSVSLEQSLCRVPSAFGEGKPPFDARVSRAGT